ncbi:hypothetical protein RZS08_41070, partial [Arthrospira platensis SPKY1]|nr:hypothetical protein [Arthrospira platensis SPKY1]
CHIIPVQIAGEDGRVAGGVATLFEAGLRAGEAAVEVQVFVHQKSRVAVAAGRGGGVAALGHPDLFAGLGDGQRVLQVGEGVLPSTAGVGARGIGLHVEAVEHAQVALPAVNAL